MNPCTRLSVPRRVLAVAAVSAFAFALLLAVSARPASSSATMHLADTTCSSVGAPPLDSVVRAIAPSSMTIVDDEPWPYSDEVGTFNLADELLGWTHCPDRLKDTEVITRCAGDEVRVELIVTTSRSIYSPTVLVSIRAHLFEGTWCWSNDLDGDKPITSFQMSPGDIVSKSLRVDNTDEGGDYANIKLTLRY
jgi:hypothetical protein